MLKEIKSNIFQRKTRAAKKEPSGFAIAVYMVLYYEKNPYMAYPYGL
ncbi:MAG: hypothetical protein ROW39_06930 [Anaerolineaceae bacterium]|jgi:hypothetical protein